MSQGSQFHMTQIEVYFALVVIALVMGSKIIAKVMKFVAESFVLMLIIRHFTGQHHHGERRTDATFWQHGSTTKRQYGHGGLMDRWEHKPIGHRMLWRWTCWLAFIGLIYGAVTEWTVTSHAAESLVVYGLACAGFVIERKIRLRVHNRHVINPIVKSLAPALRVSPHAVRRQLHISPENIKDEGEVGYFELLPEQTPSVEQQATIARIIDAHLPVDTEMDWQMQQAPKLGVIRAGLKPPVTVTWDEMVDAITKSKYGDVVIGKDRYKQVFSANFIHLDDPHWGFSVQSKRGKSNFLGLVAVQVLYWYEDNEVTVIDPKEESLIDFLGAPWSGVGTKPLLPNVHMANDPENVEQMCDYIHRARRDMDHRRAEYARNRDKKFPIHLVMIDELNMFKELVIGWWGEKLAANKRLPKEDQEDLPKECPVWADIRAMLHMGRFVGIHVICVAQDFRAEILGGHGARNGFGLRGMGGFIPAQWKMFIGTTPVPAAQRGVGRWIFWQGEQQDWVQITKCDREKAYALAANPRDRHEVEAALGYELDAPSVSVGSDSATVLPVSFSTDATTGSSAQAVDYSRRVIVGVKEAARYLGYAKWRTFDTARSRRAITGEFRQGRSPAWYADDLDAWYRDRGKGKATPSSP